MTPTEAARSQGLSFYWRVVTPDGIAHDQFDGSGEHQIGEFCTLYSKSPCDFYAGTPVLMGIQAAGWVSVVDPTKQILLEVGDSVGIVLYRKSYMGTGGLLYFTYCVGRRFSPTLEDVYYISPAYRFDSAIFDGTFERSNDPLFQTGFDRFMSQRYALSAGQPLS